MTILISGIEGQLGQALLESYSGDEKILGLNRNQFNLEDFNSCRDLILKKKPTWIINAAAFTDVNGAETEKEKTFKINTFGTANIIKAAATYGGKVIHLSSDFVFDGRKTNRYKPTDKCNPLNVYGSSKYKSEQLIMKYPNVIILRTSWLYGPVGKNFCLTILKLCKLFAKDKKPLQVVSDQIGCPTSSINLAAICWEFKSFFKNDFSTEIFHWSNSGITSWYDFAKSIIELGLEYDLLSQEVKLIPIKAVKYKEKVKRPNFSILDCEKTSKLLKIEQIFWKDSLREVIKLINYEDI